MKKGQIRFPLSRRLSLLALIQILLLSIVLIVFNYKHYRDEMFEHYEMVGMNIGAIAASQLNPDKIQYYLDTCEIDEEYERAYDTLCDIRENGGIEYLYVVKPEPDEVWYVI